MPLVLLMIGSFRMFSPGPEYAVLLELARELYPKHDVVVIVAPEACHLVSDPIVPEDVILPYLGNKEPYREPRLPEIMAALPSMRSWQNNLPEFPFRKRSKMKSGRARHRDVAHYMGMNGRRARFPMEMG